MSGYDALRAGLVALLLVSLVPAFDRVFVTGAWRLPALTAMVAALGIALLVRAAGGGAIASAVASLVGFVVLVPMLTGVTEGPTWPGPELWAALGERFTDGFRELQVTPAPTPLLSGIALILVTGFWVVTHLAHELLVRWRSTGGALIVVAVLWAAPLVVPMTTDGVRLHTVPFLAAAALTLLTTVELRPPRPRLAAAGAVMAAAAIVVAAVAPGVLPGYGSDGWYGLGRGVGVQPRGYQPIVDISQRLHNPDVRDVLRVESSRRTYLRLAGLDSFDGFTWRLGPPTDGSYRPDRESLYVATDLLPPEEPARTTEQVFVDIEVLDLANMFVPAPYQPVQVLGPHRDEMVWSTAGGFLATWDVDEGRLEADGPRVGVTQGVTYRVQSEYPAPTREQLLEVTVDEETLATWTQLPREYPELAAVAEDVYAAAGATSTIDQVLALQDWFTGGTFTYDLDVPALRGDDALERFVMEDRVGYCEYFAAAMAVMLRATDIPARVATGFLPGEVTRQADPEAGRELTEYTVTTADAHAWVEVLFPGYGWITFEPTPRTDGAQIQPRADDLTPLETERERQLRESDAPVPDPTDPTTPDEDILDPDDPAFQDPTTPDEVPDEEAVAPVEETGIPWTPVIVTLLVLIAALAAVLLHQRRRSYLDVPPAARRVLLAQDRLLRTAVYCGLDRRPGETMLEVARRWHMAGRVDSAAVRFARIAQAAAFGGIVDEGLADEAEELCGRAIADLRASVRPAERRAARVRVPWEEAKARSRELLRV